MKAAAKCFLASLLLQLCAAGALAQEAPEQPPDPAAEWASVEPEGEEFKASLPAGFSVQAQQHELGHATLTGQLYSVEEEEDGASYKIWSLRNPRPASPKDADAFSEHLDACAELARKLLADDAGRRAGERGESGPAFGMRYSHETPGGVYFLREYDFSFGERSGVLDIFSDGERIFLAAAFGRNPRNPNVKRFLNSFGVKLPSGNTVQTRDSKASPAEGAHGGTPRVVGPGRGGNTDDGGTAPSQNAAAETDYTRPFDSREVMRKAVILRKPEPQFTEAARSYSVNGLVRLRVLLGADGQVGQVLVDKRLPHGMTAKAVEAARAIRFTPAEKDGRVVSQWVVIEYNFNVY